MSEPCSRVRDGELAIFLFHGVIRRHRHPVRNYMRKHIDRERFVAVVRALNATGQAVSMDEVLLSHETGEGLPPRAFAVTFDDGFENNLTVAAPILDDLKIPATFYVTTAFIDQNAMSWIDRIEWCLERVARAKLRLPWREPVDIFDPQSKIRLLSEVRGQIKKDRHIDVAGFVTSIFEQCGLPEIHASDDEIDRKMTWAQLLQLATLPDATIGGHSHTHAILSFLDDGGLAYEIDTSLGMLKEHAGIGPRHYSYPEGLTHCYSPAVIDALRTRGVRCCPTAEDGTNPPATPLFELKRISVT